MINVIVITDKRSAVHTCYNVISYRDIFLFTRFAEQTLRDCREELQSKTEELRSVLESSTIAENELREEAKLRKRYKNKITIKP